MNRSDIRVKAYAVFRRGKEILVNEIRENDGTVIGFRIPGGHVEFGEKSIDSLKREISEELNTEGENFQALPVMEYLFHYAGKARHDLIFNYTVDFKDKSFYERETIEAFEDNGTPFELFWLDPEQCPEGTTILPTGLLDLLADAKTE